MSRGDLARLENGRRDWLEETLELAPIPRRRFTRGNHRGNPLPARFWETWHERIDEIRERRSTPRTPESVALMRRALERG